ncbi:MAG: putative calcium-transporting ATPase [Thermodesulfobacterium sp. 37_54]|nr:MAG: putative calcium-transporting ATPase [Thermodesulfobacterium sp. 37_54]
MNFSLKIFKILNFKIKIFLMEFYQKTAEEILEVLNTGPTGLSEREATQRLAIYGKNVLEKKKKSSPLTLFLSQFKDFLVFILVVAALISGFLGELIDTVTITVILLINGLIGFIQTYRAEKAMEALSKMLSLYAVVIRDGKIKKIPAEELVPGDIVLIEAGEVIPADLRLLEAYQLRVDESLLTGESVPVSKQVDPIIGEKLPVSEQKNMVFKGTFVTNGRGKGVVVATGMNTEFGKIAKMVQQEDTKTPLQKRLADFGKKLGLAILFICLLIFILGVLRGEEPLRMILTSVALAVAAVPEALPAVVTITLALGAKKMVDLNALVRNLPAVETLGSVTFICTDKTGTLTQNKMTVREVFSFEKQTNYLFLCMALNNDIRLTEEGNPTGDPTEIALYEYAKENHFEKVELQKKFPRVFEIPFDPKRKAMTTVHKKENGYIVFTKGSLETILEKSAFILLEDKIVPLTEEIKKEISDKALEFAKKGMRVLAFSYKEIPELFETETLESKLIFLGFCGMIDPPRKEVKEAIALCKSAGIKVVMVTGDHPVTAWAIAKDLSIVEKDDPLDSALITGKELEEMSLEDFEKKVEKIKVYARTSPEQKLKIVKALQEKGQFVAMTGDGVNDAPALKKADIGVSMGSGTEVAKEASDLILLDDNFATITQAVKEGRRIYDNIRKFVKYTMTSNSGEIWTVGLAPFLGLPLPLLPVHILWINLITDGLPGIALSGEREEKDIMQRPPRHPKESLFAHGLGIHIVWVGWLMGVVCLLVQGLAIKYNLHWQTMVFSVLCLSQLGHALAIRSEKESIFKIGLFSNKPLFYTIVFSVVLQLGIIYCPLFNKLFHTQPLSLRELIITFVASSIVFIAVEIEKLIKRRYKGISTKFKA